MTQLNSNLKIEAIGTLVAIALVWLLMIGLGVLDGGWRSALALFGAMSLYLVIRAGAGIRAARATPPRFTGYLSYVLAAAVAVGFFQLVEGLQLPGPPLVAVATTTLVLSTAHFVAVRLWHWLTRETA